MNIVTANPSTAQTNVNIAPAETEKILKLRHLFVSSDTALTVTLVNSATHATELIKLYLAANGGIALGPSDLVDAYWTIDGEGIDYSTSVDGNVYIRLGYESV